MAENVESWDRVAAAARMPPIPTDVAHYGPDMPDEGELRLIGDVAGKRVLDLGCGRGEAAIAFARAGAHVTAVDASAVQLERARTLAAEHEIRVEWHHGDAAELAFLRADSIDIAYSVGLLPEVDDQSRLFRQIHRVLRPHGAFVCAYEHPCATCVGESANPERPGAGAMLVRRSYFDDVPMLVDRDGARFVLHPRTIAATFAGFTRAGFAVEVLLEPEPRETGSPPLVPPTVIWRARKVGV